MSSKKEPNFIPETESPEIATITEDSTEIALTGRTYSTMAMFDESNPSLFHIGREASSEDEMLALFNATNNTATKISDHINEEIQLSNYFLQNVVMTDMNTGEIQNATRCVLIDTNGVSYGCTASGIFNALKKLVFLFGEAESWIAPISIKIRQIPVARGSMLTFDMISANGNMGRFARK